MNSAGSGFLDGINRKSTWKSALETCWQDLRFGFRVLAKNMGFAAAAALTLALGIGANTAIFSVVNAVLLRPLPFPQPERIVQVLRRSPNGDVPAVSIPDFVHWRDFNDVFDSIAAYDVLGAGVNLTDHGNAERISSTRVSAGFFDVLGVHAFLGRGFATNDDLPGSPPLVVMSFDLWKTRFHSSREIIGKTITLSDNDYTVVGVMPPQFEFPDGVDLWTSLPIPVDSQTPGNYLNCIGRLRAGIRREAARTDLDRMARQFASEHNYSGTIDGVNLPTLQSRTVAHVRPALLMLMVAVALVLLVTCANVANLLLARSAARQKEMALRTALGAGRLRLAVQLIVEALILSLLGGLIGLFLAVVGLRAILAFAPADLPRIEQSGMDVHVLSFALLLSVLSAFLFGLTPAMSSLRLNLSETLREGGTRATVSHRGIRSTLVTAEVAIALMLLISASLLLESFAKLENVNPGFNPRNLLTMKMSLSEKGYRDTSEAMGFLHTAVKRLEAEPGVRSAAMVVTLPFEQGPEMEFWIEGSHPKGASTDASGNAQYRYITSHYFSTLEIPLLRGRSFSEEDTDRSVKVVVVNDALAQHFWPNADPLGKRITVGDEDAPREIVGVVANAREIGLDVPAPSELYVPAAQVSPELLSFFLKVLPVALVIRTGSDPLTITAQVRDTIIKVNPRQPVSDLRSMDQILAGSTSRRRFNMTLVGIFAAVGLAVAAIGIYGVMSYTVTQQTREIGIRMALGGSSKDVVRLVVGNAFALICSGVAVGLFGAFALTRFISSQLYGTSATDPKVFAVVAIFLCFVGLAASYIPARRAMRVDPIEALRHE